MPNRKFHYRKKKNGGRVAVRSCITKSPKKRKKS